MQEKLENLCVQFNHRFNSNTLNCMQWITRVWQETEMQEILISTLLCPWLRLRLSILALLPRNLVLRYNLTLKSWGSKATPSAIHSFKGSYKISRPPCTVLKPDLIIKALTNYHVRNGRAQNSLLSSLLCSAIDGFKLWIHQWHYIKEKKVMNSAHGHYGPDSLPLLKEKDWILIAMLILQSSSNFNSESSFRGS